MLAPGLPPIPPEVIAERSGAGIRIGCYVIAPTEREAWSRALILVNHVVFSHPRMQGWTGTSVRRIEIRLDEAPVRG
jgi:hypothetical protein